MSRPLKERPDFIAGYDAGLADGKRCAQRDAAQPLELSDEQIECLIPAPTGYVTENGMRQLKQDDSTVLLYPYPYLIRPNEIEMFTADQLRAFARSVLAATIGEAMK